MYPEFLEIDGEEYKIDTSFETAIACFKAINDGEITDIERPYALVGLLLGEDVKIDNMQEALHKIKIYLTCNKESKGNENKIDIDLEYDRDLINASFMSDYSIDLGKTDMHWWQFFSLLNGLTEQTILNRVRDIRNYDLSEIKDNKLKKKMEKAQERVSLPVKKTKEEQDIIDKFNNLFGDD